MEIVNTKKSIYYVYGQRHSNGDVFGWQEFDDLSSAKELYEYYCCEYSYALSNININLIEFRGTQRIMHATYPIFEKKERKNAKEGDITPMEKCYVIHTEVEDAYDDRTYIEGAFTDLKTAQKFYDDLCTDYQENRQFGAVVYLTEWQGDECKNLEEYYVESRECEDVEDEEDE